MLRQLCLLGVNNEQEIRQEIRIATWNANGIMQSQGKLQVFLDTNKIDIDLISKTHLTSHILNLGDTRFITL